MSSAVLIDPMASVTADRKIQNLQQISVKMKKKRKKKEMKMRLVK
jgi:hypothetical protein